MPSKARCSKCSLSYGIKDDRISCSSCPTAAVPTFLLPGPTLSRRHRALPHHARLSPRHRTCCACVSVLTVCCAGSKPVRAQNKTRQPRRANMQRPQLELWSAEPHPTPPIYQQLTPAATEQSGQSPGRTHPQAGPETSRHCLLPPPQPKTMSDNLKIQDTHLQRCAYVYIRQSSATQVLLNRESTERQYQLSERAALLGWSKTQIKVIDEDSGSHRIGPRHSPRFCPYDP